MLRAMRENAKWIFYILAFAFVGWLVFEVGMGVTGRGQYGGADVVLKVNGRAVHVPQYQQALQAAYDQYRHQGAGRLTREDEQQISDQVVKQLVQQVLFEQEYKRLGITVSEEEVIQAARSSPPPEIMGTPEFQTNGEFDISRWQRGGARAGAPAAGRGSPGDCQVRGGREARVGRFGRGREGRRPRVDPPGRERLRAAVPERAQGAHSGRGFGAGALELRIPSHPR